MDGRHLNGPVRGPLWYNFEYSFISWYTVYKILLQNTQCTCHIQTYSVLDFTIKVTQNWWYKQYVLSNGPKASHTERPTGFSTQKSEVTENIHTAKRTKLPVDKLSVPKSTAKISRNWHWKGRNYLNLSGFYTKGRPLVKSNLMCPSDKFSWQRGCPVLNINIQGNFCISQGNGSSDNLPENLM